MAEYGREQRNQLSRVVANFATPKKRNVKQGVGFADNRPDTIKQRKLQTMTENYSTIQQRPAKKASSLAVLIQKNIQRMWDKYHQPITTQVNLNAALSQLVPPVRGMIPAQYRARGATLQMLDNAIAASNHTLYDTMSRGELLRNLRPLIDNEVTTTVANYVYDNHGDKHFPGGPPGTKFNGNKNHVNSQLETLIAVQIGRIRRDAKGHDQTYYYTLAGITECGNKALTIQISYTYNDDTITYHGYPDDSVIAYSLSRTKNGVAIP